MVSRRAWLFLCAAWFAAAGALAHEDHAGHGAAAKKGGARRPPPPELGAYAAVDPKGRIWAAYAEGGHVLVRGSEDEGRTWSAPVKANPVAEAIGASGDSRPKIAAGPGGELYVTWTKPLAKPYTGDIRFSRSIDGGRSFFAPVTIHTDRQEITHRFDSVIVNAKGQVFVSWIDKRDQVVAQRAKAEYRGAATYFAVSDDRGASFRGDFKVADHSCECCRIALLPHEDGSVLAMWRHVFAPNVRDHGMARLNPDGSVGPLARATYDDWRVDVCPHHGPSLAADAKGRLHAVWFTLAPGKEGVHYGRLRDGGVDGQRRVGGDAAEHADLAILGERVAIAWKEFDGKRSRLRAMTSDDAGATWREHELASTGDASDQPRVLARDGRFLVFWNAREFPLRVVAIP